MTLATPTPDAPHGFTLTAEVPWAGTDAEFRVRFEAPLRDLLDRTGIACSLRSHPRAGPPHRPATAGLELHTHDQPLLALILAHLPRLGAPPETTIEIDTGSATVLTTLAELGQTQAQAPPGES